MGPREGATAPAAPPVTVWFGGLTERHEQLILAALEGLGYSAGIIPTPTKADYQVGKEFGNHGQCNPTYFTVGALITHLRHLRDTEGLALQSILDQHVFLTAGACGPCRFGMYEAEFRLALDRAGFAGFRVILFEQKGGLEQASTASGLAFTRPFFLSLLNAFMLGDLLNAVAYAVRPYENATGSTDAILTHCLARCQDALRTKTYRGIQRWPVPGGVDLFLDQLGGTHYTAVLAQCRALIDDAVDVDYLRPTPLCKVTGEFWAQTTEGDGNFHMFRFLEQEGAEVLVEPLTTWLLYMLHQAEQARADRAGLPVDGARGGGPSLRAATASHRARWVLRCAGTLLRREYERGRRALGGTTDVLVDQPRLARLAAPHYTSRATGGEGHLEVAENIYYGTHDRCHFVLSLKPFGCMPSTQSDGAQAAVLARHKTLRFLPVETSGEGDIGAYSRVQMALSEATVRAVEEFDQAVRATGYPLADLRAFVAARRDLRRPLQALPRHAGVTGRAARFALHVGALMRQAGLVPCRSAP